MPKKLTSSTTTTATSRSKKTKVITSSTATGDSSIIEPLSSTEKESTISPNVLLEKIHKLDPKDHITVGTILRKYPSVKLNENKGGIVVNISTLPTEALEEIQKYVDYLSVQHNVLTKIENETNEYKQFFQ
jgi:hypothetical protein